MIEYLEEIDSTNTYLLQKSRTEHLPHLYTVCAKAQTAGRGQRGNGWESEPGKNLSFSTIFDTHEMDPSRLWKLSMLTALAVAETLRVYHLPAEIKWPNDIYVGDRKICGILIENVLQGSAIQCSIAGIGLNVNQEVFVSNAPNPVSMKQLTGCDYDLDEVLEHIVSEMERLWTIGDDELRADYMHYLYRREGSWLWRQVEVCSAPMMIEQQPAADAFRASIEDITPLGQLVLRLESGEQRVYHFKEVKYII